MLSLGIVGLGLTLRMVVLGHDRAALVPDFFDGGDQGLRLKMLSVSYTTRARCVARLAVAVFTPGNAVKLFSTRFTQDAQVMPSMASSNSLAVVIQISLFRMIGAEYHPSHRGKVYADDLEIV